MPELKGLDVGGWVAWEGDVQGIRYADKGREKQRQGNIQAKAEAIANGTYKEAEKRGRKTEAWSKKKEAKAAKAVKAVKRERKREWKERELEEKIRAEVAGEKRDAPEGEGGDDNEDDWAAMEREERLVKKMRKGKIGKGEFEKLMAEEEAELGSFDDM
jgi:ATP-dependent RNA helicase DDX55/SPB4